MASLGENVEAKTGERADQPPVIEMDPESKELTVSQDDVQLHKKRKLHGTDETAEKDVLEGGASNILPTCKLHEEPLKIYCFDCNSVICRDCTVKDHHNHNYEFITVAAPEMKKKLIQQLDPLKEVSSNLSQAVKEIQSTKSDIEAQGQSVANHIETSFEELHHIIEVRKQELLAESAKKVAEKLEHLSGQEKGLSTSCAVVQSVIDYTEQCVEHSADDEVMCVHAEIQSRIDREIEQQHKEEKTLEPVEEADVGVVVSCAEDLKQLCQTKAKINLALDCCVTVVSAEVDELSELQVTAKYLNKKPIMKQPEVVKCSLKSLAKKCFITECQVDAIKRGEYRIQYTPTVRGRHELTVTVNGQEVAGSPFPVFVSIHPTQLGKPVKVISTGSECPVDVAVNSSGEIILANQTTILQLDKKGEEMRRFVQRNTSEVFVGVAVDTTNDNVYVTTTLDLLRLSPELTLLQQCNVNQNQTRIISGVAVVGDEVMVCDQESNCIKVYSKELEFVREFGVGKGKRLFGLSSNANIVYVSDHDKDCIWVFSQDGDFLQSFHVNVPYGVGVAGDHLYVATAGHQVVVLLCTTGQKVDSFGQYGSKEGEYHYPWGLCVDHRLQIF